MEREIELLPHNELAHQKLEKTSETNQLIALNHATGTGKSFILLKYMYKRRNKRILFLSPRYPINDQLINEHMEELGINISEFKKLDTMIYKNLLNLDMEALASEYDIIVIDEYHRCGSDKCGRKIMELINIIKSKYPDKRIIGTTATEIRYLDYERNMNKLLFDGVTASTLSLADAIVQGILPIFEYVTSSKMLLEEVKKIEEKCDKYMLYNLYDLKIKTRLTRLIELIEKKIAEEKSIESYLPENGKYLAFSSTLENMYKDKKFIRDIFKNKKIEEFVVSYGKAKEVNATTLKSFRQASKDNNPVLFSIDILNEGVHVKDIDAIFMLRPTTSPIIYFQQLGRILSFSRRKDKVIVFDLVNNIGKNKAIYELYNDVINKAKELLKTDPDNKDRYERIIKEFKIIDNVEISKLLEELKTITNRSNLINLRLESAIQVLESNDASNDAFKMQAYLDVFHYEKYITLDQFKRIQALDIEKPSLFKLTESQFEKILNGRLNLIEKNASKKSRTYHSVKKFYGINYRLPTIFSDGEEQELAKKLLTDYFDFSDKRQRSITVMCYDDMSLIEEIAYGVKNEVDDLEIFYEQLEFLIENNVYINENIISFLRTRNDEKSKLYLDKILTNNEIRLNENNVSDEEVIDKEFDSNILQKRFDISTEVLFREQYEQYRLELSKKYCSSDNKEQFIKDIYEELVEFIREKFRFPRFESDEVDLFYKKTVFFEKLKENGYIDKLNNLILVAKDEYIKYMTTRTKNRLIDFMDNNNGLFPIPNVSLEEDDLLRDYQEYSGNFTEEDNKELANISKKYVNFKRSIINQYTTFIKRKGRRPNQYSDDENELQLLINMARIRPVLDTHELMIIERCEKSLTKYKESMQIYLDLIANENELESKKKK